MEKRHVSRHRLLQTKLCLMRDRRHKIWIETVEALRAQARRAADCRRCPAVGKKRAGERRPRRLEGHIGIRERVRRNGRARRRRGLRRRATGVVVVHLNNAVLDAHRVIGASLVEPGEEAVASADHCPRLSFPGKRDAWLHAIEHVLDGAGIDGGERSVVVVHVRRRRRKLHVVPHAGGHRQVAPDLPVVFREAIEHLHPEVIGAGAIARVHLIDGLNELRVVVARSGIRIAGLPGKCILRPVLEVHQRSGSAVAVDAAALEEIDHDLVDDVGIATELERVMAADGGEDIRDLRPVLIRFRNTWQRVRHAIGDQARNADAWAGRVRSCGFQVASVLEVNLIDRAVGDLSGEAGNQEALVVAGGAVRCRRAVCECGIVAVAIGAVEIGEVVVHERIVLLIDVPVQPWEEDVLPCRARGRLLAGVRDVQKELDRADALCGSDGGRALRRCDGSGR